MGKNNGLSAEKRLELLFDEGSFSELFGGSKASSVIVGVGTVLGKTVYAFSQDISVESGAAGKGYYEKIKGLYDLAYKTGNPVVAIYDSLGLKLTEAEEALKAMAEVNKRAAMLSGVVPQISVVLGTCGGSMAMSAASADLVIASKDAEIFMNSAFFGGEVKEDLSGVVAYLADTEEDAIEEARSVIDKLPSNNLTETDLYEYVNKASKETKVAASVAESLADEGSETVLFAEVDGYASLATVGGNVAVILGTPEKMTDSAAVKMTKLIKLADAYSLPVITVIGSDGIAEDEVGVLTYSTLFKAYSEATTVKINVVSGECYGAMLTCYLMGNADYNVALEGSVISPVKASAAAYALKADEMEGENEAEAIGKITLDYINESCTASKAAENGIVSAAVSSEDLKANLVSVVNMLSTKRETTPPKKHSI